MDIGKLLTYLGVLSMSLVIIKTILEIIEKTINLTKKDKKKQTHKPRTPRKHRRGK